MDSDSSESSEEDGTSSRLPRKRCRKSQDLFDCTFCERTFREYRDLELHINSHTNESHACLECDQIFTTHSQLLDHRQVVHLGVHRQCELCGREFSALAELYTHQRQVHKEEWEQRNQQTVSRNNGGSEHDQEFELEEQTRGVVWDPSSSSKIQAENQNVGAHVKITEVVLLSSSPSPPPSPLPRKAKRKRKLYFSLRPWEKMKQWKCDICGKVFRSPSQNALNRHKQNVHNKSTFTITHGKETDSTNTKASSCVKIIWKCDICERTFYRNNNYSLKRHMKNVHRLDLSMQPQPSSSKSKLNSKTDFISNAANVSSSQNGVLKMKIWRCHICGSRFYSRNRGALNQHLSNLHGGKGIPTTYLPANGTKRKWKCEICDQTFISKDRYSLQRHLRNVHKENPALYDDQPQPEPTHNFSSPEQVNPVQSSTSASLVKSGDPISGATQKFNHFSKCELCGKILSSAYALNRHKRAVHGLDNNEDFQLSDGSESDEQLSTENQTETDEDSDEEQDDGSDNDDIEEDRFAHLPIPPPVPLVPPDDFIKQLPSLLSLPPLNRFANNSLDVLFFLRMNRYQPEEEALPVTSNTYPEPRPSRTVMSSGVVDNAEERKCHKCGTVLSNNYCLKRHLKIKNCVAVKMFRENPLLRVNGYLYKCSFCGKNFDEQRVSNTFTSTIKLTCRM